MPYVVSRLANSQVYTQYVKGVNNSNMPVKSVEIKGGADVTNKNLVIPEGVVTQVSADELEILKANKEFQKHLERGYVKYFNIAPNVEKVSDKLEKDKSRQLTPDDYTKKGKKKPKTESIE